MNIIKNSTIDYYVQLKRDGIWWEIGAGSTADIAHKRAATKEGYITEHIRTLRVTTTKETEVIEDSEGTTNTKVSLCLS